MYNAGSVIVILSVVVHLRQPKPSACCCHLPNLFTIKLSSSTIFFLKIDALRTGDQQGFSCRLIDKESRRIVNTYGFCSLVCIFEFVFCFLCASFGFFKSGLETGHLFLDLFHFEKFSVHSRLQTKNKNRSGLNPE